VGLGAGLDDLENRNKSFAIVGIRNRGLENTITNAGHRIATFVSFRDLLVSGDFLLLLLAGSVFESCRGYWLCCRLLKSIEITALVVIRGRPLRRP
jgi:hypothetical protein